MVFELGLQLQKMLRYAINVYWNVNCVNYKNLGEDLKSTNRDIYALASFWVTVGKRLGKSVISIRFQRPELASATLLDHIFILEDTWGQSQK